MFNVNKISELLKDTAEQVPEEATFFISKYLKFGNKNRGFEKNNTKYLYDKTGDLYRSLQRGDVNNITNINYRPDGITIEYGTKIPYAEVHEKGMFIKASPVTVIRTYKPTKKKFNPIKNAKITAGKLKPKPFQTFQMARYFWAKYFETKEENYKYAALSVHKIGGVQIPKRPFFSSGLKDFENEGMPEILKTMLNKLLKIINE